MSRLASTLIFLLFWAIPAQAAVIATTGAMTELGAPPASTRPDQLVSNTELYLFLEQSSVTLASALAVDVQLPDTYDGSNVPTAGSGSIAAGDSIDSYFLHFEPNTGNRTVSGSVTFDHDIRGIIVYPGPLDATDGPMGAPGTLYPLPGNTDRGLEFGSTDTLTLSADLRTVTVTFREHHSRLDQIRVFTNPEPSTGLLFAAGLLGLGLRRRRV